VVVVVMVVAAVCVVWVNDGQLNILNRKKKYLPETCRVSSPAAAGVATVVLASAMVVCI
jgi:hypothetical protein